MSLGPRWRKRLRRLGIALAALVALSAIPVLYIEIGCKVSSPLQPVASQSVLPPEQRRPEIESYLTYPEWSVVHAYEDLAAVMRRSSESDYDYFGAIRRYWSSLCSVYQLASARERISTDYRLTLNVIGLSFAGEMGIKGAYEKTIGWLTATIRGPEPTPEDAFARNLADDYAAFLRQTPWYKYPFATKLWEFWRDTPLTGGNVVRKFERRIALTLEWIAKALYAKLMALGAAATPAAQRTYSVVQGLDASDVAADPRIKVIGQAGDGRAIIDTDRYRVFTEIAQGLATRGRSFTEIVGNRNIFVTVLLPDGAKVAPPGGIVLFEVPYAVRPGWRRVGLDVKVAELTALMQALKATDQVLEHVYDY